MFGNLSGPTLLVILFIVLLLFGAPKLPALAKSLGQSMRILKKEVSTSDEASADTQQASATSQSAGSNAGGTASTDAATPTSSTSGSAGAKNENGSDSSTNP